MQLKIILKGEKLSIQLTDKKKVIDSLEVNGQGNLSKNLLPNIDKLLKKNKIPKKSIEKAIYQSKIPEFYTSGRIAKSVEKSFNFVLKTK